MSYQTEEVLPIMLDGVKSSDNEKKKGSSRLAAFVVLSLAVTSFMAGRASSSSAVTAVTFDLEEDCCAIDIDIDAACGVATLECIEEGYYSAADCIDFIDHDRSFSQCIEFINGNEACIDYLRDTSI